MKNGTLVMGMIICICMMVNRVNAQKFSVIRGVVKDEHGSPLPGATIFLSGTKFATSANDAGLFNIADIPGGGYTLIIRLIGYEIFTKDLPALSTDINLEIYLHPSATQLSEVIIRPRKINSGLLKLFKTQFLGSSANASNCKLLNPEVISFEFDKRNKILTAESDEPLIILNRALGYKISYYLRQFTFKVNTSSLFYEGYPLFEELYGKERDKNYKINRENTYHGSLQQLIRALYNGTWKEDGFTVLKFRSLKEMGLKNDSRSLEDTREIDKDSFISKGGNGHLILQSQDPLYIIFSNKREEPEYISNGYSITGIFKEKKFSDGEASILTLKTAIDIDRQGNYSPTRGLQVEGYLGWLRIADLLPFGFVSNGQ